MNGNLLQGKYQTDRVYAWFQNRHQRYNSRIDPRGVYHSQSTNGNGKPHTWRVPYGIRATALNQRLVSMQMTVRYPWLVVWTSPKTSRRLKKYFMSLPAAIDFIATRVQYIDPQASIVSRSVGYDIPPALRGKIPAHMGKWCPYCMTNRKFYRVYPESTFTANVRLPSNKGGYTYSERVLPLLECRVCGMTNRDTKYRRSNQYWEVRRFKPGVRRASKVKRKKR